MPITNPAQRQMFNANYENLGHYLTDNERIPHLNPADSGELILPGEPILKQWGASGHRYVFMAQGPIRPGEIGYLVRNFKAKFPADLSANVVQGAELYWDEDESVVSLVGDVTNGYRIGYADYVLDPNLKNDGLEVDGNGRVICGTDESTHVVVQSQDSNTTTKGTVTVF